MWSINVNLRKRPDEAARLALESALEEFGESLSSFEANGGRGWRIEVLASKRPPAKAVRRALSGLTDIAPAIGRLPERDWVAESERGLPPISVGPFFIHGSHFRGRVPPAARAAGLAFTIDAGMAFGTGRHETTRLCLGAIVRLSRSRRYRRPMDLGTGTGILALAMAKLFGCTVMAADNDADAIRIARENVILNGCARQVRVIRANRYDTRTLRSAGPYDLVVCNILAGPLVELAPGLAPVLARGGRAILSGLLKEQEPSVLAAYDAEGFALDFRRHLGEWSVLVMKRGPQKRTGGC